MNFLTKKFYELCDKYFFCNFRWPSRTNVMIHTPYHYILTSITVPGLSPSTKLNANDHHKQALAPNDMNLHSRCKQITKECRLKALLQCHQYKCNVCGCEFKYTYHHLYKYYSLHYHEWASSKSLSIPVQIHSHISWIKNFWAKEWRWVNIYSQSARICQNIYQLFSGYQLLISTTCSVTGYNLTYYITTFMQHISSK